MADEARFKELAVGKTLNGGKYIIESVLGVGGFGITYYALHTVLNRYCAIKEFFISGYCLRSTQTCKIFLQGISVTDYNNFKQKFLEEARTLAKLDHPSIVKVIDMFDENDTSYIVMPFIEGPTLQQLVDQEGKLGYEVAVNYIAQLTNAIGYIHDRNILHRDIKPDNIIITPEYQVVLIDFGSAREFVHDKTQSHTAILTKGYAPLEQYSNIGKKGSYSDIYSLGAVFYFALTGRKPIDAAARTMEKMLEPKAFNPEIPDEANDTIMKAMQLKPEDRYMTVAKFMDDLLLRKAAKARNNKLLFFGLTAVMLVIAFIFYLFTTKPPDDQSPAPRATTTTQRTASNTTSQTNQTTTSLAENEQERLAEQERKVKEEADRIRKEEADKKAKEAEDARQAAQRLQTLKRDAKTAFDAKNWNRAYTLYQDIKKLDANDHTGYNNFLNLATEIMSLIGCDETVKAHLTKAKNLRNTNEVNDLLKRCN